MNELIKIGSSEINEITTIKNQRKMSSREIAKITGKRHTDVCRDIRKMLEQLKLGESIFASSYTTAQNKQVIEYLLPFHELHVLLTGYSIPLRSKVLKRWEELETGEAAPVVKNEVVLQQQETIKQLTDYNALLKSKLEEKEQILKMLQPSGFGEISERTNRAKTNLVEAFFRSPALRSRGYTITAMSPTGELVQLLLPFNYAM